jgi:hypothetical protein
VGRLLTGGQLAFDRRDLGAVVERARASRPWKARRARDLWRFDLVAATWEELPLDGAPVGRSFATFDYDPDTDAYYLSGGMQAKVYGPFTEAGRLVVAP